MDVKSWYCESVGRNVICDKNDTMNCLVCGMYHDDENEETEEK